jgi:hypothetical protein
VSVKSVARAVAGVLLLVPSVAHAVEGGVEDRSTTHAIAIARGTPGRESVKCSGTLISANVVLTVRHCVADVIDAPKACDVRLADVAPSVVDDLWVNASPWTDEGARWKKASSIRVPVANANAICGDDIALVVLRDEVPVSEALPARPVTDESELLRVVEPGVLGLSAFGVTAANATDVGTRRARFDIPIRCLPGRTGLACDADRAFIGEGELTSGAGPCRGDSGGAAIASADHGVIFGVLSRGEAGSDEKSCALGVFERTDRWAWLIARAVLDASPPSVPAPAWASDLFPAAPAKGRFCNGASSCGEGLTCATFDDGRSYVCATSCSTDDACSAGETCREGACARAEMAPPSAAGSSCTFVTPSLRGESASVGIVAIQLALLLRRRRRSGRRLR